MLLATASVLVGISSQARAREVEPWEPFPPTASTNDFGDVGLLQTPSARFAPDGQITLGANHVWPYDRYFFTVQGLPWFEATLRLTTVRNRLYSDVPDFSGNQSYKDRGFDVKIRMLKEGHWTPALAMGLRDFLGTGLFSSEYFVANKNVGPLDLSLGVAWGNLGARGGIPNPFRVFGSRFDERGNFTRLGGTTSNAYFKGREIGLFGGVKYESPIKGLIFKAEYDSNDYQHDALGNRFPTKLPVNFGVDYAVRSWLRLGTSFERGNRLGLNMVMTTNFNQPFRIPKFDPPAPPVEQTRDGTLPYKPKAATQTPDAPGAEAATARLQPDAPAPAATQLPPLDAPATTSSLVPPPSETARLADALGAQGAGIYAANFRENEVTIYVAQSRFANMALGLGRLSRAAFAALPPRYKAVTFVFVEGGLQTISAHVYRASLVDALTPGRGSAEELYARTEFSVPPLDMRDANFKGDMSKVPPRVYYSIRPSLKTTLGRPEQFLLYQAGIRLNADLDIKPGLIIQSSFAINLADNFDKLKIPSDSVLPHVRSDIKEYLREGKTSFATLHANYSFNIARALYGHVYGGLLEEMFGGVGGEVLYRPATKNWALGAEVTYARQRGYDQMFDFLKYSVVTGFVSGEYYLPDYNIDLRLKAGRYLAKDYGATFEISRTFDSGVTIGAFATKTNVPANKFGEGRFDKGIYLSVPIDALFSRHVRGSVGLLYRPLIRDGGQMLSVPQPLLLTTDDSTKAKFRRGWDDVLN